MREKTRMKKKIKLVVSDLDGTLLNRESLLSEVNKDAVKELRRQGILFTFATGRMDKLTWHYAHELDLELPVISCNGAMLRAAGKEDWLYRKTLPEASVAEIKRLGDAADADYLFYGADTVYHVPGSRRISFFTYYNSLAEKSGQDQVKIVCLDSMPGGLPQEAITKSFVVFPEGQGTDGELAVQLAAIKGVHAVVSINGAYDLSPEGSSKGDAAAKLAESLGIGLDEVCCIGDQANDISMLKIAGLAIGMSSGSPEIIPYCDHMAGDFDQDGLGLALRRYVLN